MMNIKICTKVEAPLKSVIEGFDERLFNALVPPGFSMKLKQFDGVYAGAIIRLTTYLFHLIPQEWENHIISQEEDENSFEFVDHGIRVPPGLSSWEHKHRLLKKADHTLIIDDVSYTCPIRILELLFYPAIYFVFASRKRVYRGFFGRK